jgi:hypothetical protein
MMIRNNYTIPHLLSFIALSHANLHCLQVVDDQLQQSLLKEMLSSKGFFDAAGLSKQDQSSLVIKYVEQKPFIEAGICEPEEEGGIPESGPNALYISYATS